MKNSRVTATVILLCLMPTACLKRDKDMALAEIASHSFVLAGGMEAETHCDDSDRKRFDLAGEWRFRFDDGDQGLAERWFERTSTDAAWSAIKVPAAWDMEHPGGFNKETIAWYFRKFTLAALGAFVRLRFEGVFREARVWLNGVELGRNEIPYLSFTFDVTDRLKTNQENILVVRVDNRLTRTSFPCDTSLHPGRHGWLPYGGIWRPVYLEGGKTASVRQALITTDHLGSFSARVHIKSPAGKSVTGWVEAWITRGLDEVHRWDRFTMRRQPLALRYLARLDNALPWSPETPQNIYTFNVKLMDQSGGSETVSYSFAFKRFEAREGKFFLNGEDFFLRGMNRHEDHLVYGPLFNQQLMAGDLALMKELSVNFCRPGHYPNDVRGLRAYEQAGILLAQETPVYQWDGLQMADEVLISKALKALEMMIVRDYNRPGIGMWSLANEVLSWEGSCNAFITRLCDRARELDPQRPVMVAAVTAPVVSEMDHCSGVADAVGVNEYLGWYYGAVDQVKGYLEAVHPLFPGCTMFISEYGAAALYGRHGSGPMGDEPLDDHSYSEEWQVHFHTQHISQFLSLNYIRGIMPWVFADFRMEWSPTTGKPHPVDRMNLKGLVTGDRQKKALFHYIAGKYADMKANQP